jgi:hypothetical protein
LAHRQPILPTVLAVNGMDPAIYERHAAIGRPLPVAFVRISLGPTGHWIDQPTDHLPTPAELAAICPECTYAPCDCTRTDEAVDLRAEAEAYGLWSEWGED